MKSIAKRCRSKDEALEVESALDCPLRVFRVISAMRAVSPLYPPRTDIVKT